LERDEALAELHRQFGGELELPVSVKIAAGRKPG
jgi:hypothetical protein